MEVTQLGGATFIKVFYITVNVLTTQSETTVDRSTAGLVLQTKCQPQEFVI